MITPRICLDCAVGFLLFGLSVAPAAEAPPQTAKSAIDGDAMAALDKMGAELRSHQLLSVKSDFTADDVLTSGEKLQYGGTVQVLARRPDRFKISAVSDQRDREIFYDGRSVTVFSPRLGFYASFAAPPTIYETVQKASAEFDIQLPLADLFIWGTDKSDTAKITSAFFVDLEHIGSRPCNHYAFRQEHVDWELWIQQDGPALPCKLVITNRDEPAMPQYSTVLQWSFPASIADATFKFVAPAKAHKIEFVSAGKPGAH